MPYAPDPVRDLACSLVAVAPTPASSGVTLSVTPGEGALFPFPADILIWADGVLPLRTGSSPAEEARLTGVVGDTLTVVRAQGTPVTSAIAVTVGMRVATVRSAAQILADQAQISANTVAIAGKVSSVTAADGSVTIGGTATAPTVHANVPTIADASTTVKGIVELATAPVSPTLPIAVGDNDPRLTSPAQKTANLSDLASIPTAKTNLALVKTDVGLGSVDNTSDVNKPVSTLQAAADALRPTMSGLPTAAGQVPQASGTSSNAAAWGPPGASIGTAAALSLVLGG